jgi:hypothetical protein
VDGADRTQVDVSWDQNRAILDPSQPACVPGHRVEVHIPFSGEKDVFKYRPSSFTTVLPTAELREGELVQTIEYPADSPRNVRAEADGLVAQVNRYLEWAHGDIERFNGSLAGGRGLQSSAGEIACARTTSVSPRPASRCDALTRRRRRTSRM